MTDKITCYAPYLQDILDTKDAVRKASLILRKGQWQTTEIYDYEKDEYIVARIGRQRPIEFDTLVGIGLSGTLLLPMLADRLKCNYLALRKDKDGSHSGGRHQGTLGKKWLFFDDLISTGDTLRKAYEKVDKIVEDHNNWQKVLDEPAEFKTEFVGAYLFTSDRGLNLQPASELINRYRVPTPEFLAEEKRKEAERQKRLEERQKLRANSNEGYLEQAMFGNVKKDDWVLRA